MSAHLSDEQFTRYLSGDEDSRAQAHLAECAACRGQATQLVKIVGASRAHAEVSSDRHANDWARQRNEVRDTLVGWRPARRTWAIASAMALLVFVSTFMFQSQEQRSPLRYRPENTPQATMSDDALLSAVNSALEQDVPFALAPLQQLASEREQAEQRFIGQN